MFRVYGMVISHDNLYLIVDKQSESNVLPARNNKRYRASAAHTMIWS